jgi:hypothetical protein
LSTGTTLPFTFTLPSILATCSSRSSCLDSMILTIICTHTDLFSCGHNTHTYKYNHMHSIYTSNLRKRQQVLAKQENSVTVIQTYPRNFAPTGPSSRILLARASPSMSGGGFDSLSLRRYLQVTLIGMAALRGGTITRTPECLQPLIAPPLASTRKLTKKLMTYKALVSHKI